ncbi:MAG: RHS repeat-associated core domain-containing protein [Chloroflexia bacterium]
MAEPVAVSGCTLNPNFGYAGQYTDSDSGLQYLRARYYDPATQQFLSRDPLEAQTGQAYGYANGNPVNVTDPSGLEGGFWSQQLPTVPGGMGPDGGGGAFEAGGGAMRG